MAFKARSILAGITDTSIFQCPVGTEGAVVIGIGNITGVAATYTLKFKSAALGTTMAIATAATIAANKFEKFAIPLSMEAGDEIIASGSAANTVTVQATITLGTPGPQFTGFTPRGAYSGAATYQINHFVSLNGASYASRVNDNTGHSPDASPNEWVQLSAKGETGTPGTNGTNGADGAPGTDGVSPTAATTQAIADAATAKATPVDADFFSIFDSAASKVIKKLTWANLKATLGLVIGTTVQGYDAATAKTDAIQSWSKPQRTPLAALTSGTTITMTLATANDFSLTLAHNGALANPSDIATYVGQKGSIAGAQDATGGRTLSVGTFWSPIGAATVPDLPATANAKWRLDYHVVSATRIDFSLAGVGV